MGNHKRRGENLESEDPLLRRFFQVTGGEPVFAALFECPMNAVEHFHQIGARAAAGIEHVDVLVGKAKRQAQLLAQYGIDALHHVLHNLGRRVPDTELLAQFGVKGLQERLVKVLHGVAFLEVAEEGGAVHAIEHGACPIEHLGKLEGVKLAADRRPARTAARSWERGATKP